MTTRTRTWRPRLETLEDRCVPSTFAAFDLDARHIGGINQVGWDVAPSPLHVESDELLEQHTRYALIVTRGLRDADGLPVEPSEQFERFRHDLNFGQTHDSALKGYRKDLLDALQA